MSQSLGLIDLITPQYLAGIQLSEQIQNYLSILRVQEINVFYEDQYIVYTGNADFKEFEDDDPHYNRDPNNEIEHENPNGASFKWEKKELHFRMMIPRTGAEFIDDITKNPGDNENLKQIASLLHGFQIETTNDTENPDLKDFPAIAFRLELLVDVLNFSLGDDWKPGKLDSDNRVVVDQDNPQQKVEISLPKVLLSYSQSNDAENLNPQLEIKNWGTMGFDAPSDLAMGELIRMHPSIASHESENFAFSIDQVVLDCSTESTPSNVLSHFGIDEEWTGIYVGRALLYYSNDQGLGFNVRFKDVLISFDGEVSLEAALDVFMDETLSELSVTPHFYDGAKKLEGLERGEISYSDSTDLQNGKITVPVGSVMQLDISGGMPSYTVHVERNGFSVPNDERTVKFGPEGLYVIKIKVQDSSEGLNGPQTVMEYIDVTVKKPKKKNDDKGNPQQGTSADNPPSEEPLQRFEEAALEDAVEGNDDYHELKIEESENGNKLNIRVLKGPKPFTISITKADGSIIKFSNKNFISWPVPNGTLLTIKADFIQEADDTTIDDAEKEPDNFVNFKTAWPGDEHSDKPKIEYYTYPKPLSKGGKTGDPAFDESIQELARELPNSDSIKKIKLEGWCSLKNPNYNDDNLADRRLEVLEDILSDEYNGIDFDRIRQVHNELPFQPKSNDKNQTVGITFYSKENEGDPNHKEITATVKRPSYETPEEPQPNPPEKTPTPDAPSLPNSIPPVLKQLGIRIKVEKNRLSLLELYGKIDFQAPLNKKIRSEQKRLGKVDTGDSGGNSADEDNKDSVGLKHPDDPDKEKIDGVVDFKITYQYDRATQETKYALTLGSDEEDTNGLLQMENKDNNTFKNVLGAFSLFAPIINEEATTVIAGTGDGIDNVVLGASLAIPFVIAGLGIFRTRSITLYGGELYTRYVSHSEESQTSKDFGITFDYEVQFDIVIEQLGIGTDRADWSDQAVPPPPLRARYKALGANLNYSKTDGKKGFTYTPIFDASKGYELDLSDPSLFKMDNALGDILNVVGARVARFNPVTLEVDFALKVDLGVVTVDKFKLKIPIDSDDPPMIIPSGVKVNIPGVLVGDGFVEFGEDSFEGGLDLTLVSLKIRVAGNLAISKIEDEQNKRDAVGVFVGLKVEFPTPIVLGATGLGIYGFLGVFAMHYKRLEEDDVPTSAVGPALQWLIKADGNPQKLRNKQNDKMWGIDLAHWSFGIGVLLGTMEGGFLVNMQGMFVLELPGPRILIMVKAKMISKLPANPAKDAKQLKTGIIGIVDIDFERDQLTLGVMLNFSIKQVLAVKLPIELYFKWDNPSNWHLWLGTIAQPASAEILGIAKGYAYLMIQGNELDYGKFGDNVPKFFRDKKLQGIALAVGMEASLVMGKESSGVYLKISAGAHLGVSFSPFLVLGNIYFEGKLRLVVLSIGARGNFDALISQKPNSEELKVYLKGEVCGSVDLFFFDIEACIGLTIGDEKFDIEPPELVRGVYLQSFSPVLTSGQGSTRPIDASLGNAKETGSGDDDLITVPIDTIPVIQLHAAPKIDSGFSDESFIESPGSASGTNGVIQLSDEVKVTYTLNSVKLQEKQDEGYNDFDLSYVPSVWRIDRPQNGSPTDTSIDLATFSRTPTTAPHAIERSKELIVNTRTRWENICKNAAPPATVLFTFCGQEIGYSSSGWSLTGIPKPDPEDTLRRTPVNKVMRVYETDPNKRFESSEILKDNIGFGSCRPARILGIERINIQIQKKEEPKKKTSKENEVRKMRELKNKWIFEPERFKKTQHLKKELKIFDSHVDDHISRVLKGLADRPWIVKTNLKKDEHEKKSSILKKPLKSIKPLFQKINLEKLSIKSKLEALGLKPTPTPLSGDKNKESDLNDVLESDCMRILQLPYCKHYDEVLIKELYALKNFNDIKEIKDYLESLSNDCFINFETGACESIIFLGGLLDLTPEENPSGETNNPLLDMLSDPFLPDSKLKNHMKGYTTEKILDEIEVEELDSNQNILTTYKLSELILTEIESADILMGWLDPESVWGTDLLPGLLYLGMQQNNYQTVMFELKPKNKNMASVRIHSCLREIGYPSLLISAIETLQTDEKEHHHNLSEMLKNDQNTLENYLKGNSDTPLLKPDKEYRISVDYKAVVETRKDKDDSFTVSKEVPNVQEFSFKTDKEPPKALSPYVLAITPKMEEPFHFYKDPLQVVFNDDSFLKMFKAYGKKLKAVIRGADGLPVNKSPENIDELDELPGKVQSSYRETIESLAKEGMPCILEINTQNHALFEAPFELKPGMPYTFDIEVNSINSDEDDNETNGNESFIKPFFRTAFKTSRFANLGEFAKNCRANGLNHLAMTKVFENLPVRHNTPNKIEVQTLTDIAFENLLKSGGIDPTNTEQTTISLCWVKSSDNFTPFAVLIDACEPLWRTRKEPKKQAVLNAQMEEIDPAFKIYQEKEVESMVLQATGNVGRITQFIKTTSGSRTLVLFDDKVIPEDGEDCIFELVQTGSELFDLKEKTAEVITFKLLPKAPWED